MQLPLPILPPKLDVTLPQEHRALRGNSRPQHLALEHLAPRAPGCLIPPPSPEVALTSLWELLGHGHTHTAANTTFSASPPGARGPGGHADPLHAVCLGGLAPPQLTGT